MDFIYKENDKLNDDTYLIIMKTYEDNLEGTRTESISTAIIQRSILDEFIQEEAEKSDGESGSILLYICDPLDGTILSTGEKYYRLRK